MSQTLGGSAFLESEKNYRFLFDCNPQPMWVSDEETCRFLAVNLAALTLYGYTEEKFLSLSMPDILPPQDITKAVLNSVPHSVRDYLDFKRHCKKNGEIMEVEIASDTLVFNERPVRLVAVTDITARKVSERKLAEQAALIDKARDAIFLCDLEHKILFWNKGAEYLYGWCSEEAVGEKISRLIAQDAEGQAESTQAVLERGEWSGERRHRTKAGLEVIVEARWTLLRDDLNRPKSILAISTDVTERKKMESHFLRAQRMESIGTVAGGITHDLNNLLSPILIGVDLLKQGGATTPQGLLIVEQIEESAKRGSSLVRQVLSFARGVESSKSSIQIESIVREVESIIRLFPKNITTEILVCKAPWLVSGDPTQLDQVLLNLCVNARDAMPKGGRLSISVENVFVEAERPSFHGVMPSGPYVLLTVTDSGCGISKENIHKIFEPFFTTKEFGKGTGLGLATVLGVIRSHGGFLDVESECNQGSSFKVYLPAQTGPIPDEPPAAQGPAWQRGNGEWILIVDDEFPILNLIQQALTAYGYHVLLAENGARAVSVFALNRDKISLVLVDMMMPIMDGPSTIRALRQIDPAIKIVGTSGLRVSGPEAEAIEANTQDFLSKPFTTRTLLKSLKAALSEPA